MREQLTRQIASKNARGSAPNVLTIEILYALRCGDGRDSVILAPSREGLTATKCTAGQERLRGWATPCVPGSAGG